MGRIANEKPPRGAIRVMLILIRLNFNYKSDTWVIFIVLQILLIINNM